MKCKVKWICEIMGILRKFGEIPTSKNLNQRMNDLMKVVIDMFNLSDGLVRLLQIFIHELLDGYNVKMLIKTLFMNWLKKFLQFLLDLENFILRKVYEYIS